MEKLLLKVEEAADQLRLSRAQTFRLIASGELPVVKIGASTRVPASELIAYVERLQGRQPQTAA